MIIGLLLAGLLLGAQPASSRSECVVDQQALLALSPENFDRGKDAGWRALAENNTCFHEAAGVVALYRSSHWGKLTAHQLHLSFWHEGQLRALSGDGRTAVPLLLSGVPPEGGDEIDFADYALGTVAFIQGDLLSLRSARARLALLPKPEWLKAAAEAARQKHQSFPSWPPNLDVLDGLISCFKQPYQVAYNCR